MESLLNLRETAEICRVSVPTLRLWTYRGKLPVVKLGRKCLFRRSDLETFIARSTSPTTEIQAQA